MKESQAVDYSLPTFSKPKWALYTTGLFIAAFLMYFPIGEKTESMVRKTLASLPGCSITYDTMEFGWFLPKLVVKDLQMPSRCFGSRGAPLILEETFLYIRGISFSPLGPHFKLATTVMKTPIEAQITLGVTGALTAALHDNTIDLANLKPILPEGMLLAGNAKVNVMAEASPSGLNDLDLKIESKDFALPGQTIQAFRISRLPINNLLVKADLKPNGQLELQEAVIGDADSPIRANFKGDLKLNKAAPVMSPINLKGEIAFSQKFMEDYSIIGMFMNQFDKKDDFYQIQIKGNLARPQVSSP